MRRECEVKRVESGSRTVSERRCAPSRGWVCGERHAGSVAHSFVAERAGDTGEEALVQHAQQSTARAVTHAGEA